MGRLIVFALFLLNSSSSFSSSILFLSAQILSGRVLSISGRIVMKFGDLIDMDVNLCKRVSNFIMTDSKAGPQAWSKPPKFCSDYFLLTTEVIVLNFSI